MVTTRKPLVLMCEDDSGGAAALVDTANAHFGFDVAPPVASGAEAVALSSSIQPDLVIIDMALLGEPGLRTISALHAAAPNCAVVVVAQPPFASLRAAAIEAGAMALVELADPRQLRSCLRQVAATVKDPLACSARTPVGAPSAATAITVAERQGRITASSVTANPGSDPTGAGGSSSSAPR